jgi:hypothetical protein
MSKGTLCVVSIAVVASAAAVGVAAAARAAQTGRLALVGVPPMPQPSDFHARVDNPWFPLTPGTRYVYTGVKDGQTSRDVVTVTHETKMIAGVPCVAVHDRLYLRGRLGERTTDWYSQDRQGNVWYFGEDTAELDRRGRVTTTEGTWMTGVHGARPGIFMPAHPRVGQTGQQEFYAGHAEDHFRVIAVFTSTTGPRVANALMTQEWTPLEPGTIDHKTYVRGIGTVLEQTVKGGDERNELVSVTHG